MLRDLIWRDLRWRLLAVLPLPVLLASLVSWSYVMEAGVKPMPPYAEWLDTAWFHLPGPSAHFILVAVVLACSNAMRRRPEVAYLLALPVSRRRWLLSHLAATLGAIAFLLLLVDVIFWIGAWRAGASLAPLPLLGRTLSVLLAASFTACVTVGMLALLRHPVLTALVVLGLIAVLPNERFQLTLPVQPAPLTLPAWDPWRVADARAWDGAVPWVGLVAGLTWIGLGLFVSAYRFSRTDQG